MSIQLVVIDKEEVVFDVLKGFHVLIVKGIRRKHKNFIPRSIGVLENYQNIQGPVRSVQKKVETMAKDFNEVNFEVQKNVKIIENIRKVKEVY